MADVIAEAFVAIQPEPGTEARLARTLQSRMGPSLARVGRVVGLAFAGAATAAVGGLALVARTGLREAADAAKVQAQIAAGIRSTGGAAKVTADQLSDYAGALQGQTGIADDVIQQGQSLILTFTKVRNEVGKGNDVFNRATKAALDLSARGFGSVESASLQLGKALNDPVKGIAALSRAGITFTAQQKAQIKALVDSNRMLDAQKIILAEVETQVGGSAEAVGNTLPGQLQKARRAFEDVAEAAVTALMPALSRTAGALVPLIKRLAPVLTGAFDAVADGIARFAKGFAGLPLTKTTRETGDLADVQKRLAAAADAARDATDKYGRKSSQSRDAFMRYNAVLREYREAQEGVTTTTEVSGGVLAGFGRILRDIVDAARDTITSFVSGEVLGGPGFLGFVRDLAAEIGNFFRVLFGGSDAVREEAHSAFTIFAETLRDVAGAVADLVLAIAPPLYDAVKATAGFLGENLIPILGGLAAAIVAVNIAQLVDGLVEAATVAGGLGSAISGALGGPIGIAVIALAALATGVAIAYRESEGFRRVVQAVGDAIAGVVVPAFRAFSERVLPAVRAAFDTIVQAFRDNEEGLRNLVGALAAVARFVGGVLLAALGALIRVLGPVLSVAIRVVATVIGGLIRVLAGVGNAIGPVVGFVRALASAIADQLGRAVNFVQGAFGVFMAVLRPVIAVVRFLASVVVYLLAIAFYPILRVIGLVVIAFRKFGDAAGPAIAPILQGLIKTLQAVANFITDKVMPPIRRIIDLIKVTLAGAIEAVKPVVEDIGAVFSRVFGAVEVVIDGVVTAIRNALNIIIRAINNIPDITIPGLGTVGIPDIAEIGAAASTNTGGTGTGATVRDPEARRSGAQDVARAVRQELTGLAVVLNGRVVGAIDDAQGRRATVRSR